MKLWFIGRHTSSNINAVNLKWKGSVHNIGPLGSKSGEFSVHIPFHNKPQEDYTIFNVQKRPPITIARIEVKEPFKLIDVSPKLPVTIADNEKVVFTAKIAAPQAAYEGPLGIEFYEDSGATVHLEISKIILSTQTKKVEMKDRSAIMDVAKGMVFRQNLHLYGIVDFGQTVKEISATPPFKVVSTDPKVPFTLDNKTGYLIDTYVQAPQSNYGGPLEINLLL